jgi:hypothetical protein
MGFLAAGATAAAMGLGIGGSAFATTAHRPKPSRCHPAVLLTPTHGHPTHVVMGKAKPAHLKIKVDSCPVLIPVRNWGPILIPVRNRGPIVVPAHWRGPVLVPAKGKPVVVGPAGTTSQR